MLTIHVLSKRTLMFSKDLEDWDLHIATILGENNNYIIDTGLGSDHIQVIIDEVKSRNDKPIIVINSHYHWDHIWGNDACKDYPIVASELTYEILEERFDSDYEKNKAYKMGSVKRHLPNITFSDCLDFKDDGLHLFLAPGHTKDSICVYDKIDNILHIIDNIGDNLEDLLPSLEVSMSEYYDSLMLMKSFKARLYTCGHNQVIDNSTFDKLIKEVEENI